MSTLKTNNIEHLDASTPSIQTTIGGGTILAGVSTVSGTLSVGTGTSISSPATNELALGTNDVERLRITSDGKIGIGTNSPGTILDARGNIQFGDGGGFDMNILGTRHQFSINGSEKLRITSGGQLQAISAADVRLTLGSSGTAGTNDSVHVRADGSNLLFMNGSGGITKFESNGTETLRIKSTGTVGFNNPTYNSNALIQTDAKDNTAYAPPTAYPANQIEIQNSVSMGSAIMRFRSQSDNASAGIWNVGAVPRTGSLVSDFVFQSRTADSTYTEIARFSGSGGILFNGDTAQANALDDYEEGFWNPTVNSGSSPGSILSVNRARYVKIGTQCTIWCELIFDGGDAGNVRLQSVPYNAVSTGTGGGQPGGGMSSVGPVLFNNLNITGVTSIKAYIFYCFRSIKCYNYIVRIITSKFSYTYFRGLHPVIRTYF